MKPGANSSRRRSTGPVLLLPLLFLLTTNCGGNPDPQTKGTAGFQPHFAYTTGPDPVTISEVKNWQPVRSTVLPAYDNETLWLRLEFRNPGKRSLVLEYADPRVDELHCYTRLNDQWIHQGSAGEAIKGRNLSLRPGIILDTAEQVQGFVYVSVKNPFNVNTGLTILEEDKYLENSRLRSLTQSSFLGLILVTIVFYSLSLVSRNRPMVTGYILYLTGLAAYLSYRNGLYHLLPVNGGPWSSLPAPFFALMYFGGIHFFRHFLEIGNRSIGGRLLLGCQLAVLSIFPLYWFSQEWTFAVGMYLSYIIPPAILLASLILSFKSHAARIFSVLWSLPILFAVLETLGRTGLVEKAWSEDLFLQSGLLFQILGFSSYLGYVIRKEERTRIEQETRLLILQDDLDRARDLLTSHLPDSLELTGYRIHAHYRPSSELGGDYYDLIVRKDGSAGILVADVSGHGLPAALEASTVHVAHRSTGNETTSAGGVLQGMASYLDPMQSYRYLSAIYAVIHPETGTVEISRAGHPPALILRADGKVQSCGPMAPLLGLVADHAYREETEILNPGDRLLLYTDGVYEIADEELHRPPELPEVLSKYSHLKGEEFIAAVCAEFEKFRPAGYQDDVTFLEIERLG